MATQVTLFPFTGLPAPAVGEPTNQGNTITGPVRVVIQDPGVDLAKKTVCIKIASVHDGQTPARSRLHRSRRMPTRTCYEYRSICWIQRS